VEWRGRLDLGKDVVAELLVDGCWYESDSGRVTFMDIFQNGVSHEVPDFINKVPRYSVGNKIIGTTELEGGRASLYAYDVRDGSSSVAKGVYSFHSSDGIDIYSHSKELTCFDLNLNKKWAVPFGTRSKSNASAIPLFYDDFVIILHTKDVLAFRKSDGQKVWQYTLDSPSQTISVANDRVYLTQGFDLLVLDVHTGEKQFQEVVGFLSESDISGGGGSLNEMAVYPISDELIMIYASGDYDIKFYSIDGKSCVQSLGIRETGYALGTRNNPPMVVNDIIYLPVSNMYTSYAGAGGLLMLEPALNDEVLQILRQERYPVSIYAVPSLDGFHQYRIYVEGDNLDHVCRYAGIAAKELVYETGYIPSLKGIKKGAVDYLHDGLIELVIDPLSCSMDDSQELRDLMESLEKYLHVTGARAGIEIYKIKFKFNLEKREEWEMEGDLLDLDKIREIGKPLNEKPDVSEEWID
jgi:hypothetical protein